MDVVREVRLTAAFLSSLMVFKTRTSRILRKVGQFRSIFVRKPSDGDVAQALHVPAYVAYYGSNRNRSLTLEI